MTRVGVVVAADTVTGACKDVSGAPWVQIVPRSAALVADIVSILEAAPRGPLWRPRITVAVQGIVASKIVRGLPATRRAATLHRILQGTPERFFIGEPGSLVPTRVDVTQPGVIVAAAIPAIIVNAVVVACVATHCTLKRITVADLVLKLMGQDGMTAADLALAVTDVGRRARVSVVPDASHRRPSARTIKLSSVVLAIGLLSSFALRPSLQQRASARARRELARLADKRAEALRTKAELDSATEMIDAVSDFVDGRGSATLLMRAMSDALPDGAALTSLQYDSTGVSLSVVAPNVSDIVRDIGETPGFMDVQINGSVSHDATLHQASAAGVASIQTTSPPPLERVTLKFRVDAPLLTRRARIDLEKAAHRS